jgi:polyphosphate kinase 2 (PPK2 family)
LKYWLDVDEAEQTRRLQARVDDPRKVWKLSPMDLDSYSKWYDYSVARDDMLALTDTSWAPWFVVDSNDKRKARLNIISHLLDQIPYEPTPPPDIKFPARQKPGDYVEPRRAYHLVPDLS